MGWIGRGGRVGRLSSAVLRLSAESSSGWLDGAEMSALSAVFALGSDLVVSCVSLPLEGCCSPHVLDVFLTLLLFLVPPHDSAFVTDPPLCYTSAIPLWLG